MKPPYSKHYKGDLLQCQHCGSVAERYCGPSHIAVLIFGSKFIVCGEGCATRLHVHLESKMFATPI